jgi:SNF2 family DNA or RNA helicase
MTMKDGHLVKKEPLGLDANRTIPPTPTGKSPISTLEPGPASSGDDEEEANEYSDDDIVVPWGHMLTGVKVGPGVDPALPSDVEEEPVYSEDEYFAGECCRGIMLIVAARFTESKSQRDHDQESTTQPSTGDLSLHRPNFPLTPEQYDIGSLVLDDTSSDVAIPASINRFLKPYQRSGVEFLFRKYRAGTGGILGDDMGWVQDRGLLTCRLGKTIQVISFVCTCSVHQLNSSCQPSCANPAPA